jgi:PKD repeat protein
MQRKKCFLIAVLLVLLIGFFASFQPTKASLGVSSSVYPPPPIEWTRTYGGAGEQIAYSVQQTSDNGFILFGISTPNGWSVKVDSEGNMQWNKTYTNAFNAGQITEDGGFVLVGNQITKTNSSGDILWQRDCTRTGYYVSLRTIQQTSDEGFVVAGGSSPIGVNDDDFYLMKTDSSGNAAWNRTFGETTANEFVNSVGQTSDGGYILAGEKFSFNASWPDAWIVKTDAVGNMVWNRVFSDLGKGRLNSIKQTSDGGYIVAGDNNQQPELGSGKYNDFWLIKLDSNGNVQWHTSFGGEGVQSDSAKSVQQTIDGGFIMVGPSGSYGIWLIKTDSLGRMIWNMTFASWSPDVIQTSDGGYAVACSTLGVPPDYTSDIQLIKILRDEPLVAHFKYSPTNPIVNESIVFNASYSYDRNQDIVSHSWDFDDDGIYSATNPVAVHRYDHPGIFNVSLTVVDAEGLNSSCSEVVNIPSGPPVARFEYSPSTPVFQENIIFDSSSSYDRNLDIVSYLWNFDDGNVTSITNPIIVHRYENAGIYNVSLSVVDAEGLNSSYALVLCARIPTSISLTTYTPSATADYCVIISGTLIDLYGNRIENGTVDLYYAFSGYENWNLIASVNVDPSINFIAAWIPPAPSYFVIKAVYAGNYTHTESSKNVTLSILPYGEAYLFSVESNSTVSSMGFDTNNQTLSFTATGVEGTKSYAKVTAAKSLVPNLALLGVYVDGVEYKCGNYTVTDADDSWVLLFVYEHSAHLIEIQLDSTIPEFPSFLIITLFVIATLLAVIVQNRKHSSLQKRLNSPRE